MGFSSSRVRARAELDWWHRAACRRVDPEVFFPIGAKPGYPAQAEAARRVCGQCPVRQPCLAYALAHPELAGIWGGTTQHERHPTRHSLRAGLPPDTP